MVEAGRNQIYDYRIRVRVLQGEVERSGAEGNICVYLSLPINHIIHNWLPEVHK